jgi:hypothetical protein
MSAPGSPSAGATEFDLGEARRTVVRRQRVGAQRQVLARAELARKRIAEPTDERQRPFRQLAELHRRDGLARRVERYEPDGVQTRSVACELVPLDLERAPRLQLPVDE